jgi:hypothetical protein
MTMTPSLRRVLLSTLPLLPLVSLAGCGNPLSQHLEWKRHSETVVFVPEPLYCYRTLARSDCFSQPLDRKETDRLVGFYGPPPGMERTSMQTAKEKFGEIKDHAPLMLPREKVETQPLVLTPRPLPMGSKDTTNY